MFRFLASALFLAGVGAALTRDDSRVLVAEAQFQQSVATCKTARVFSDVVSELWSELIIEAAEKPVDVAKSDKAVKDKFISDCTVALDCHASSLDTVDGVVEGLCGDAGGKASECKTMAKDYRKAHKDRKLKPWCEKTFVWFAAKTKPRCLQKCKAFLCKDRCVLKDRVDDLSDEKAAYEIKLDTISSKEKRLKGVAQEQKTLLAKIDNLNTTMCTPALKKITKFEATQNQLGKDFGALVKATANARNENDVAFDHLKKLRTDRKAKKGDVSKAEATFNKASKALKEAKEKQSAKNKQVIAAAAELTKAREIKKVKCQKTSDMQKEYDAKQMTYDNDVLSVAAEREKTEEAVDKVIAKKKDEESALADALKSL